MMSIQSKNNSYKPIADYGVIGDCRSAALVGVDGSIDWCCFPRFDAPSVFAAILDARDGGHFAIAPVGAHRSTQGYVGETNVLETRYETDDGVCTLTDLMPLYRADSGGPAELHQIIRLLRCLEGQVTLHVEYAPRPGYALTPTTLESNGDTIVWRGDDRSLTLDSSVALEVSGGRARGLITLREGEEATFVVTYRDASTREEADGLTPEQRAERTLDFWNSKSSDLGYRGLWRDEIVRSYLVLHLLTYVSTGGIVAAPTTSLPEEIGGVRNWDYRYTWLRDAAFTIDALVSLDHLDEALSFFQWLGGVCARFGRDLQIMYRVDAEAELREEELPHMEGYRSSIPVRIGNGAARQTQLDIYGEVLASGYLLATKRHPTDDSMWGLLSTLANLAAERWKEPDNGIWEVRGGPFHFVYSKVMCWVALDRAVRLAKETGRESLESGRWESTARAIKEEVLRRGWSDKKQAFVQHYESEAMDASNLLLPLMGSLPFDDLRIISTIQRVRDELGNGPFLHRYRPDETDDGLVGDEGAFTLCSFWLVRVLAHMGRAGEARRLLDEIVEHANHLGLFSEMVDSRTGVALGNFPQAFTHIGLVLAVLDCRKATV